MCGLTFRGWPGLMSTCEPGSLLVSSDIWRNQIISSNLFSRTTSVLYVGKYNRSRERSGNVLITKDLPELSSDSLITQYNVSLFVDPLVEFDK